ncbi:MAG: septum formation initiator family protein [Muribaculaceae bacterium]|nr:septum formation initiator family protein [Muribaculaceae bacterium]
MKKKDNQQNKSESLPRSIWFNVPLLILVVSFVVILFVQENNIFVIQQHNNQIRELKQEIARVNDSTEYYLRKTRELNTSREELERISREQYRMKKEKEDVFITDIE